MTDYIDEKTPWNNAEHYLVTLGKEYTEAMRICREIPYLTNPKKRRYFYQGFRKHISGLLQEMRTTKRFKKETLNEIKKIFNKTSITYSLHDYNILLDNFDSIADLYAEGDVMEFKAPKKKKKDAAPPIQSLRSCHTSSGYGSRQRRRCHGSSFGA